MRARSLGALFLTAAVFAGAAALTGCPKSGPAQKAGSKIDRAADKVSDTFDPKGPAEKAGRKVDRATGN